MPVTHPVTGPQKAAVLLIALGPELSGRLLRTLDDGHIEQLTREILAMQQVSEDVQVNVLSNVFEMAVANNIIAAGGGQQFVRAMLSKGLGEQQADEMLQRLRTRKRSQPFEFLNEVDASQLIGFIQNEHPQTIALLISNLRLSTATDLFSSLLPELQAEVALRIATMDRTSPEIVDSLEKVLRSKLSTVVSQEFSAAGGTEFLVKILNSADRSTERRILDYLDGVDPELSSEIRKLMFLFDDLIRLDDRSIQRVLREIDSKDLVLALKGASEELRGRIYKNQSSRASQMLKEELEAMGPVRLRAIEEAQQRIAATVRRLEEADEIVIAKGGEDVFI